MSAARGWTPCLQTSSRKNHLRELSRPTTFWICDLSPSWIKKPAASDALQTSERKSADDLFIGAFFTHSASACGLKWRRLSRACPLRCGEVQTDDESRIGGRHCMEFGSRAAKRGHVAAQESERFY